MVTPLLPSEDNSQSRRGVLYRAAAKGKAAMAKRVITSFDNCLNKMRIQK
jgi:hypothetical protein